MSLEAVLAAYWNNFTGSNNFHWIVWPQTVPVIELDVTLPLLSFTVTVAVTFSMQLPVGNCPA